MWTSRMKLWTFMCTSKIVRERERPVWGSWSGTSIIHSGSMSCQVNHLRALVPFSFEAWRMSSFSVSLRVQVRGRSGGWGKRLSSKLGVGCRGGSVLGVVGRVPCASVDRRSLLVWMDGGACVVPFYSASTVPPSSVNLFSLFFC